MKRSINSLVLTVLSLVWTGVYLVAAEESESKESHCQKIADKMAKAIQEDPSKVLLIVEDTVITNEDCACQVIQYAINATNAGPELVRQIILTVSNIAPHMSATIKACLADEKISPRGQGDGGKQVEDVYGDSGKGVATVYDGGKSPQMVLPAENVENDFGLPMSNNDFTFAPSNPLQGVYISPPSPGRPPINPNEPGIPIVPNPVSPSTATPIVPDSTSPILPTR